MLRHVIAPARAFSQIPHTITRNPRLGSHAKNLLNWQLSLPADAKENLSDTGRKAGLKRSAFQEGKMVAAGRGNLLASRLIHRSSGEPGWFLYAPTCALVEADRARRGTAEHLAALPGLTILDLDLSAALAVAPETTWATAHTMHAAQPSPDRPEGGVVATTDSETWKGFPVRVLDLTP